MNEIVKTDNFVLSTGGGTPCFHNNIDLMNKNGITIYLKAESKALFSRLKNMNITNRPLISGKNNIELKQFVEETLKQREKYYNKSKYIFDALNVKNIEIVNQLK